MWFQNVVESGMFETSNGLPKNAGMKTGNHAKNSFKKLSAFAISVFNIAVPIQEPLKDCPAQS